MNTKAMMAPPKALDEEDIEILIRNGYEKVQQFFDATEEDISIILDIDEDHAKVLIDNADKALIQMIQEDRQQQLGIPREV